MESGRSSISSDDVYEYGQGVVEQFDMNEVSEFRLWEFKKMFGTGNLCGDNKETWNIYNINTWGLTVIISEYM